MGVHPTAYAADTEALRPDALYPYAAFVRASGIAKSRVREARLMGLPLPTLEVGKRLFVRGCDGIDWIERLAAKMAEAEAGK